MEGNPAKSQEAPSAPTNVPIQCPQCEGSDVATTEVTNKKEETIGRIIMGVVGLAAAAAGYCYGAAAPLNARLTAAA